MTNPKIFDKKPTQMELEPGTYYWCSCGYSEGQPFCDGSHQGTEFTPVSFEVTEKKSVAFCLCKQTKNAPYCDGYHANL
ncbi:MAG: CDGSH iron-sulfur domain-containing protein [Cyanobacteria bacterium J06592_8]